MKKFPSLTETMKYARNSVNPNRLNAVETHLVGTTWAFIEAKMMNKQKDEGKLKCKDFHKETAAKLFGIDVGDVTEEQRKVGKKVNFMELYSSPVNLTSNPSVKRKTFAEIMRGRSILHTFLKKRKSI